MKKIAALLLSTLMLLTNAVALECDSSAVNQAGQTVVAENPVAPQAEQTVWITRTHNGRRQKRLWSITYRRWLTDWIDID